MNDEAVKLLLSSIPITFSMVSLFFPKKAVVQILTFIIPPIIIAAAYLVYPPIRGYPFFMWFLMLFTAIQMIAPAYFLTTLDE